MSKFSLIARIQHWMDSVPGQTFMNYAYSWGAAVVILGTLFKLTHIPGANAMLFIGMGTEVFVFFIAGFDRPFDAKKDTELADEFIDLEELEALKVAATRAASTEGVQPVIIGGGGVPAGGTIVGGGTAAADGEAVAAGGGGGTVIIGGGSPSGGGTIVMGGGGVIGGGGGGISDEAAANLAAAAQAAAAVGSTGGVAGGVPAGEGGVIAGGGISDEAAASLAAAAQAAAGAQAALAAAGGPEGFLANAQAVNAPEVEDAVEAYVDQLQQLTEVLGRVREQASRMTTDSEEMVNLNRTLTGINTIYEMQLKSVSQQVGTIDHINEQTHRMAAQIEELNGVYSRMIEALTVNMPKT